MNAKLIKPLASTIPTWWHELLWQGSKKTFN